MTVTPRTHRTVHEIKVLAPADVVYDLVARTENWPLIFPPTVWVRSLEQEGDRERLRIWATANGQVKTWTSGRRLFPAQRRVEFRQEVSQPPVAAMGGAWVISELSERETLVVLEHDYAAVGDDPDNVAWIEQAVDRNSHAELTALKDTAEGSTGQDDLLLSFADTMAVDGSAEDVFDFIRRADKWTERLPHVARVALAEEVPNIQVLEMDTLTKDGSTHTTRSVRVLFPHDLIVYKQLVLPALLTLHTGSWEVRPRSGGGVELTSRHTAAIKPGAVVGVLGEGATVADARDFVRKALSGNSTATMELARQHAERRS